MLTLGGSVLASSNGKSALLSRHVKPRDSSPHRSPLRPAPHAISNTVSIFTVASTPKVRDAAHNQRFFTTKHTPPKAIEI